MTDLASMPLHISPSLYAEVLRILDLPDGTVITLADYAKAVAIEGERMAS